MLTIHTGECAVERTYWNLDETILPTDCSLAMVKAQQLDARAPSRHTLLGKRGYCC
jgi:hypothetical protein